MPFHLTLTTPDTTEAIHVRVPTQWADVSLRQFVQLFAGGAEEQSPVEVLTGLPAGTVERLSVQAVRQLTTLLTFAADPSDVLALLPTPGLPDIGSLPYGTLLLSQQAIAAAPDRPALAHGPRLLALYRVQLTYGKYDEARVAACEAALLAAPVTESYGDLAFFLSSYSSYTSATPPTPTTLLSPSPKNRKPGVKNWLNGLARCFRWMRRPAAPSSTTRASSTPTPTR